MSERYANARRRMVGELSEMGALKSEAVRQAFLKVPRDRFVAATFAAQSYLDDALPIGDGQTITKPSVVAHMVEALSIQRGKVLEIGTGSGYATAILAELSDEVYTIERHRSLGLSARRLLQGLAYHNIHYRTGDGGEGWADAGPFDRILVTAEAREIPGNLVDQLAHDGMLVIPLNGRLCAVSHGGGEVASRDLGPARFVPLVTRAVGRKLS